MFQLLDTELGGGTIAGKGAGVKLGRFTAKGLCTAGVAAGEDGEKGLCASIEGASAG